MEKELTLKEIYDGVGKCKKCGKEYGYDIPSKFKKKFFGKTKILPGYVDSGLCPFCDKNNKEAAHILRSQNQKV